VDFLFFHFFLHFLDFVFDFVFGFFFRFFLLLFQLFKANNLEKYEHTATPRVTQSA
jgi:hypothetical protein